MRQQRYTIVLRLAAAAIVSAQATKRQFRTTLNSIAATAPAGGSKQEHASRGAMNVFLAAVFGRRLANRKTVPCILVWGLAGYGAAGPIDYLREVSELSATMRDTAGR